MSWDDAADRTLPATPRRRTAARAEGHVWHSTELSAALMLGGCALLLGLFGPQLVASCADWLQQSLLAPPVVRSEQLADALQTPLLRPLVASAAAMLAGCWLVALLARGLQVGPLLVPALVRPRLQRISLLGGWRRIVSADALARGPIWLFKLCAIAAVCWWTLSHHAADLAALSLASPPALAVSLGGLIVSFAARLCGALLLVAALDAGWAWFSHERSLRMTPDELREERRESGTSRRRAASRFSAPAAVKGRVDG